jgi:5-methylcytosine-specific restriction endonuclease McrA
VSLKSNNRITNKELGLLKGAVRRVFSRSDLRREALALSIVPHIDPKRSRVKKWSRCAECGELSPTYLMDVDHKNPIIPVDKAFKDMSLDDVVDNTWCELKNLQILDEKCHNRKTKAENALRRKNKKEAKK